MTLLVQHSLIHWALGLHLAGSTAMTPKKNYFLLPARTPAFVDRKIGRLNFKFRKLPGTDMLKGE